jgi:hypothetical protein
MAQEFGWSDGRKSRQVLLDGVPAEIRTQHLQNKIQSVRLEVFAAVTVKNVVFWDIRTRFVLHRRHITSRLQSPAG